MMMSELKQLSQGWTEEDGFLRYLHGNKKKALPAYLNIQKREEAWMMRKILA